MNHSTIVIASLMDPSAVEVASVLGALYFLLGLYNQARKAMGKEPRQISPQPFEVKEHESRASERDCLQRFSQHERDIAELKQTRQADQREASIHRKSIYDKIEDTRKELLKQNDDIRKELGNQIDVMPDKMVALLRNTGAIGGGSRN